MRNKVAGPLVIILILFGSISPASAGSYTKTWTPSGYSECKATSVTNSTGSSTSKSYGSCSVKVNMKYRASDGWLNWIGWKTSSWYVKWSSAPNVTPVQGFHGLTVPGQSTYWSTYA